MDETPTPGRLYVTWYTALMWPFSKKKAKESKPRKIMRRMVVGFIIGGAISSIVGNTLLKEKKREHLGEDEQE